MIPQSQLSPPKRATSSVPTANFPTEELPNIEQISYATSDGTASGTRPTVSSNGHPDIQGSTIQNPTNSLQPGPTSQASTSMISPFMEESSGTTRPITKRSAPPTQVAESQARQSPKPLSESKNFTSKHSDTSNASKISEPEEWKDGWLRPPTLAAMFLVTIGLIRTIPALCVLSTQRNGIAQVNDSVVTIIKYAVRPALAWASLPVFLVTLYGLAFAAVVAACSTRQSYVELRTENEESGAGINQSILLDYNFYWSFRQPCIAWKNKHSLLIVAFTFTPIAKVILPSLTAHLFNATIVNTDVSSVVTQNTTFDPSRFTYRTDLVPIFDIFSSTLVYGGISPAWTTFNYSIMNFSNPPIPRRSTRSSNFSVNTTAYSANLDCVVLDESQYSLTLTSDGQGWQFQGLDRGCPLTGGLLAGGLGSQNFTYYMQSFANVECDLDSGESRLVVLAAANFNGSLTTLTNITTISCETTYFNTTGTLDVTLDLASSATPRIRNFTPVSITTMENPRPEFWQGFETLLYEASTNDGIATTSAIDFGRLILEYARTIEPQAYLSSDVLLNSTESIFSAVYAVMSRTFLVQPTTAAVGITDTISISTTRLLVVTPVAYAITGILCAVCLILVWIALHVRTHKSILYEKPRGLLGAAAILSRSALDEQVNSMRMTSDTGKVVETVEKGGSPKELGDSGWRIEMWKSPKQSRIVTTPRARPQQWKSTFTRNVC
jgi:hypothetical protein